MVTEQRAGETSRPPFADITVLDCSRAVPGAFCGALLAGLGARVIQVEDVGGDSDAPRSYFVDEEAARHSVYTPYLQSGKEYLALDLQDETERAALKALAAAADVVLIDWRADVLREVGIDPEALGALNPNGVVVSVTPYGRTGPKAEWLASDLTLYHVAGLGYATPGLVYGPEKYPPLRAGSMQGELVPGMMAAATIAAALFGDVAGTMDGTYVDFSCQEAMVNAFRQHVGTYAFNKSGQQRDAARGRGAGGTIENLLVPCKDGFIQIQWAGIRQWEVLKDLIPDSEWMNDEEVATPRQRYRNWAIIRPKLYEWAAQFERDELFFLCQGRGLPAAPVYDGQKLFESPVLRERDFWTEQEGPDGTLTIPRNLFLFQNADWVDRGPRQPISDESLNALNAAGALGDHLAAVQTRSKERAATVQGSVGRAG